MSDGRVFLDTDIFLYLFDETAPAKSARAAQLVRQGLASGRGVVSYQVVQECCNTILRKARRPARVHDLESFVGLTLEPMLAIQPSLELAYQALRLQARDDVAWYDALIVAAALEADCAVLYSEGFQHGRRFGELRVENPFL